MNKYNQILRRGIIPISQGSDYSDSVQLNQDNGTPLNLTGYTVRSQLRFAGTDALVATFTTSIPTPSNGIVLRSLADTVTALLVPYASANYVWGVELTTPSGNVLPEIQGGAIVTAEVVK